MAKFFQRRTRTHNFVTENGEVFSQENSYPIFYYWKWQSFFKGELVPNILWLKMTVFHQEISYPRFGGYKFSRRTRTLILMSTISPGEVVPRYDFSRRNCPRVRLLQEKSYPIFWVRFLLGTTSPGYDFSRSPLCVLATNGFLIIILNLN